MLWIHDTISSITLLNKYPYQRRLTLIVILLPKDVGCLKINLLRIINIYRSEYDLILNYLRLKQGMKNTEK